MASCTLEIYFGDTATVQSSGTGTQADPIVFTAVGSVGGGGGLGGATVVTNADGSITIDAVDVLGAATTATIAAGADDVGQAVIVVNPDGTITINAVDTAGTATTATLTAPCSVTAGGLTGTQIGSMVHGCTVVALAGQHPRDVLPPAGFPEHWTQDFSGGVLGSERWVIQADTDGAFDWQQIA